MTDAAAGLKTGPSRSVPLKLSALQQTGQPVHVLTLPLPAGEGQYRVVARLQTDGWTGEAQVRVSRSRQRAPERGADVAVLGRGLQAVLPDAHTTVPDGWRGPILIDLTGQVSARLVRKAIEAAQAGAHLCFATLTPARVARLADMLGLPLRVHGARGNFMGVYHYRKHHPVFAGLGGGGLADGSWAETLPSWALDELPGAEIAAGCFSVPDGGRDFLWRATVQTVRYGDGQVTFWQLPLGERRGGTLGTHLLDGLARWLTVGSRGTSAGT